MLSCLCHSSLLVNLKSFCSSNLFGVKIFVWYYAQCFFILCFLKDKILRAFQILFIFILTSGTVNIVVVLGVKYRRKQNWAFIPWPRHCQVCAAACDEHTGIQCYELWAPHRCLHLLPCHRHSSEKEIALIQRWKDCTFPAAACSSDSFNRTHTSNASEVAVDPAAPDSL